MEQIVHIVDDDDGFRDSLAWLVVSDGRTTRSYASAEAFLAEARPGMNGCLVTDIAMGGMSGLELHAQLAERGIDLPTIVVTGHGDLPQAVEAFRAGAVDFIEKPFDDGYLMERIAFCLEQDRRKSVRRERVETRQQRLALLTAREREVMEHIVSGKLNKQIADLMGIAVKTVEVHRSRVMTKMQVHTLAELVRLKLADMPGADSDEP